MDSKTNIYLLKSFLTRSKVALMVISTVNKFECIQREKKMYRKSFAEKAIRDMVWQGQSSQIVFSLLIQIIYTMSCVYVES